MILTTGRIRDQWHTMTRTGKVQKLKQHIDQAFLEINPADAELYGIKTDDIVVIKSKNGEVQVPAKVTDEIRRGVVFLPMHWGKVLSGNGIRTNNMTTDLVDPKSKEPDFKYTTVAVAKYNKTPERLVVVGAGAAAIQFIRSYREKNTTDEIIVISKEIHPFYNRVLLPDYIAGSLTWEALQKTGKKEIEKHHIELITGVFLEKIDTVNKTILCSNGENIAYNKLILATGSRPNLAKPEWMQY